MTMANNIIMSQDWIFARQCGQHRGKKPRKCGRGDAGSPANRSLSSSEWTPLDLAGVLAASSLNRSAASPLARSGWETPRLTAAGLLCKGGGCGGTERQVKAWLLWQSRGDVDPAGRYSDDKQQRQEEEEESGWAGRRVWAGLELHKLITRDANAKRSASFTRHIWKRPTRFDIRDTFICRVPLRCRRLRVIFWVFFGGGCH